MLPGTRAEPALVEHVRDPGVGVLVEERVDLPAHIVVRRVESAGT